MSVKFEYLKYDKAPLTEETINYEQEDGTTLKSKMTPFRKLTYLMVDLLTNTFTELEAEEKRNTPNIEINPTTVFGYLPDGRRKYEYLAETVITMLEFENDKLNNIFNTLFKQPILVDGEKKYLTFDNDILSDEIKESLKVIIKRQNFKFPLNDTAYKQFSYHITESYKNVIYTDFVKAQELQNKQKNFTNSQFLAMEDKTKAKGLHIN